MFYPFKVSDPLSGLQYRLNDTRLSELSLAPLPQVWAPVPVVKAAPNSVWAESFANAPAETASAVVVALEDLILATPDLRPPQIGALPDGRAGRHFVALLGLWNQLGEALPEGLAPVRHVLGLPVGQFLDRLPVVDGSLDPLAPASLRALYERLRAEFGSVPAQEQPVRAVAGSRLHVLQDGVTAACIETGPVDASLQVFGLRDQASCADFAAARARALIEAGCPARDIAVLASADTRHLARAFGAQGVPLSGLPVMRPERDVVGETALHLLLAKRPPTPAIVLAALALSPLMPWASQTGRDLAEGLMSGDFRGLILEATPDHKALWDDIRATASSLPQLRLLTDRICARLTDGAAVRARMALPHGDGPLDWETILRAVTVAPPSSSEPLRSLEGVSLWSASESPWRTCRHLIVADFTDGLYPIRPQANPLFLDSEIESIFAATGLALRGRASGLAQGLALFDEQLRSVSGSVAFLIPWRDLAGARLAPSAGLSLIARSVDGLKDAGNLVTDLSRLPPSDWPVTWHLPAKAPDVPEPPDVLEFAGRSLLALRQEDDGRNAPQSPSRLETLVVSPLAWLLEELGAKDLAWKAETLDVLIKGTIAHHVFEHVFLAEMPPPEIADLPVAVGDAFETAIARYAGFLRSPSWELERGNLLRDLKGAALRWRDHLIALGARILANEIWLRGEGQGIRLHGKADVILELPGGALLVVDHKKSGTTARRRRMEAGWDLQAGLYRDMLAHPEPKEGDKMHHLIGRAVGIAYHLMNDGGLLTSGLALGSVGQVRDMGDQVNVNVIEHLRTRLDEVRAGMVRLNTTADEAMFKKEGGFTAYALTDGSPLVRAFLRPAPEAEA
jgi:hypothetical protein